MCINFNYYLLCIFACIYPYCCVFKIKKNKKVLDHVFQVLVMAGLNACVLQSKLLITPLSE